jgi:hypothetical protein
MENKKMSYLDKIMLSLEEGKPAAKVVNPDDDRDRVVTGGRTGQTTGTKRLMKGGTKKASASAADRVKMHTAGPKGKLPENIAYAFNRWAQHLAEAGRELGGVAKPYEGKKTSDIKDPRVRSAAEQQKAKVDRKLGVKTNPDAGQLVQQSQEQKRDKKRQGGAAGTSTEPKDIAKADAAEDKKKMAGDR